LATVTSCAWHWTEHYTFFARELRRDAWPKCFSLRVIVPVQLYTLWHQNACMSLAFSELLIDRAVFS